MPEQVGVEGAVGQVDAVERVLPLQLQADEVAPDRPGGNAAAGAVEEGSPVQGEIPGKMAARAGEEIEMPAAELVGVRGDFLAVPFFERLFEKLVAPAVADPEPVAGFQIDEGVDLEIAALQDVVPRSPNSKMPAPSRKKPRFSGKKRLKRVRLTCSWSAST